MRRRRDRGSSFTPAGWPAPVPDPSGPGSSPPRAGDDRAKNKSQRMVLVRVDLHNHTWYSKDGMMSPEKLINLARRRGLDAIAITDHNRLTIVESTFPVIPGEEIKTTKGEVIGLFLQEEIPRGLEPEETFDRIREQDGLIVIPHPFDKFRKRTALLLNGVEPPKDALIEVLNARYISPRFFERAKLYAEARNLPLVAGSDAHTPVEVAKAWTEVPEFSDLEELRDHLRKGRTRPEGEFSNPFVHLTVPEIKILHLLGILPR